jgi:hypothetical protein
LRKLDKRKYQQLLDQYNISFFGETSVTDSDLDEEDLLALPAPRSFASPARAFASPRSFGSPPIKNHHQLIPTSISVLRKVKVPVETTMNDPRKCLS